MSHRVHRISELISHDELCRRISYNPETGETFWRVGNGRRVKAGDPAGCSAGDYTVIKISGQRIYLHRVIWFLVTGCEPEEDIDHRDTDKMNNRWQNLRLASHSQNIVNRQKSQDVGLRFYKSRGWQASMVKDRTRHIFGYFSTKEEAREARRMGEQSLFGEFSRAS